MLRDGMLNSLARILIRQLLAVIPREEVTYRACKRYIDSFNNDNNCDMQSNGELFLLRSSLQGFSGPVVFDVGASVGQWAKAALVVNPTAQVHCFEPGISSFQKLQAAKLDGCVFLNNFGLGSQSGEHVLHVFDDVPEMSSLYVRRGLEPRGIPTQKTKETVHLKTLDEYCCEKHIERIDLMKIDVEGYELEVLRGGRNTFEAAVPLVVQFEYGGCNIDSRALLADLFDFLQAYSYRIFKLYPNEIRPILGYDQRLESFQYANYVAKKV